MHLLAPRQRHTLTLAALSLALCTLAACGKKDEAAAATQVAAKVGSEEISVHQINQVLSHSNTGGANAADVQRISREVLEKLIDQQLIVDQATETKLNRSPEVVAAIESAKREVLARAYVQQLTAALPKPSAADVQKYYAEHPALFAQRRVFNLQEVIAPTSPGLLEQLRGFAAAGKTTEDVSAYLKGASIQHTNGAAARPAEQIPLELLDRLQAMKDGQSTVLEASKALTYVRVASSQNAPLGAEAAAPRIELFLTNQRANEAVASTLKQLRASTKISYMGEFAKPLEQAPAAPATAAPADDKAPAEKAAIDKGVSGLK